MEVKTQLRGDQDTIEVSSEQIYAFDPPLGGFEQLRRFVLIADDGDSPVEWLQSVEDESVAFALLEPFLFDPNYAFELPDRDAEDLGMQGPEDAFVRCILTLRDDPGQITANLLAPLVFCRRTHMARQLVLQDSGFALRHPVFSAMGRAAA
jgi:flagellar assembly factor FliW